MGRMKEYYFNVLEGLIDLKTCTCPVNVKGVEEMCPMCQQEYDEWLCEQYDNRFDDDFINDAEIILLKGSK